MTEIMSGVWGNEIVHAAQIWLAKRRLSRHWKRSFVISFNEWRETGVFPVETMLADLNDLHDDELEDLARFLGMIGGLSHTVADIEYHVDAVNGSDLTGDGSAANPYATLWTLQFLPSTIRHLVRYVIHSDINVYEINTSRFVFEEMGSLAFIGAAAPEIHSTNHEITIASPLWNSCGQYADITAVAPWAIRELEGWWVEMLDGPREHWAAPIISNTASSLYVPTCSGGPYLSFNVGEHFRIVRPALTLTVTNLKIKANINDRALNANEASARITFANLIVDATDAIAHPGSCLEGEIAAPFTIFRGLEHLKTAVVNLHSSLDPAISNLSETEILNYESITLGVGPTPGLAGTIFEPPGGASFEIRSGSCLVGVVCKAIVTWLTGDAAIRYSGFSGRLALNQAFPAQPVLASNPISLAIYMLTTAPHDLESPLTIYSSYADVNFLTYVSVDGWGPTYGVQLVGAGSARLKVGHNPALFVSWAPDYGFHFGTAGNEPAMFRVLQINDPVTDLNGAINDLCFEDGVPTVAAYPAAYFGVEDASGSHACLYMRGFI